MDTKVNYTLVGAFVIVLVAAIVLVTIWLSSGLSVVSYTTYVMYSQESVSGLSVDATVEYNGVKVGAVKDIELNADDPHLVTVLMKIQSSTPITRGTVATLTSRGITGVAFIALKDIGNDQTRLVALPGEDYPVITTAPSLFMRVDLALKKFSKNFETIADSIHNLLDKDNLRSIKQTLEHLDKVTETLANNSQKINLLLTNSTLASEQLSNQTLPATYNLLSNLNDVTRTLNEVTMQLKQNPSILIRGSADAPLGPGERK
jgi:phospholipid/cholesterol/gamma-HCH transport system substrate-binding protein